MQEQTITALRESLAAAGLPFVQDEPLAGHTTFKIGGPAAFWCTPHNAEELRSTLALCRENGARVYLLGNGSNTLFDDAGFDGAVIDMRGVAEMEHSDADNDVVRITAGAGQTLGRLCSKAQALGLTGLEFACGIPGTVGGAVYMNAGAYGGELKDVLESVTFLDDNLQLRTLPAADLAMGYRTSIFEQNPGWLHPVGHGRSAPRRWCCRACQDAGAAGQAQGKAAAGVAQRGQHLQAARGRVCGQADRGLRPAGLYRGRRADQRETLLALSSTAAARPVPTW